MTWVSKGKGMDGMSIADIIKDVMNIDELPNSSTEIMDLIDDALYECYGYWKVHNLRIEANKIKRTYKKKFCEICGSTEKPQVHHKYPVSLGGDNTLENLITVCDKCHKELHTEENIRRLVG